MKDDAEAHTAMQKSINNSSASMVFAYAGGFCIGYPVGQMLGGGKPEWSLLAIGSGLILVAALPFAVAANQNSRLAVRLYNAKVKQSGAVKAKIELGMTPAGIGLLCRF